MEAFVVHMSSAFGKLNFTTHSLSVYGSGQLLTSCLLHDLYVPETALLNSSKKKGLNNIIM